MLVRFKSEVGGFTMFGDVAVKLIRMTGHSGTVPGAIDAEHLGDALSRLEQAMQAQSEPLASDVPNSAQSGDEDAPTPVSLNQRAFPLLELMRRAVEQNCALQWQEGTSF